MILNGPSLTPREGAPTSAVVLLHGYGANGDDLIDLGHAWRDMLPQTVFLAPDAPEEIPFAGLGGRQWFPLTVRDPEEFWQGVNHAAPVVAAYLDDLLQRYDLTMSHVALVGFSQGCMMALHVGLRRPDSPAALIGFSGRLAGPEHLSTDLVSRPPILLVHGEDDEVIPVEAIHVAGQALKGAGLSVDCHVRPGLGHGIDTVGLGLAGRFLMNHLDVRQNSATDC